MYYLVTLVSYGVKYYQNVLNNYNFTDARNADTKGRHLAEMLLQECRLTSKTQFRCSADGVVTQYCGNTQFVLANLYRVRAVLWFRD